MFTSQESDQGAYSVTVRRKGSFPRPSPPSSAYSPHQMSNQGRVSAPLASQGAPQWHHERQVSPCFPDIGVASWPGPLPCIRVCPQHLVEWYEETAKSSMLEEPFCE